MRAARDRRTPSGAVLLPGERVTVSTAFDGFLAPLADPAGPPRVVRPGAPADLVVLQGSLRDCLADPDAERVRLVLKDGRVVHAAS
jgi:predicted amidohydrolase YtcJ